MSALWWTSLSELHEGDVQMLVEELWKGPQHLLRDPATHPHGPPGVSCKSSQENQTHTHTACSYCLLGFSSPINRDVWPISCILHISYRYAVKCLEKKTEIRIFRVTPFVRKVSLLHAAKLGVLCTQLHFFYLSWNTTHTHTPTHTWTTTRQYDNLHESYWWSSSWHRWYVKVWSFLYPFLCLFVCFFKSRISYVNVNTHTNDVYLFCFVRVSCSSITRSNARETFSPCFRLKA